MPKQCLIAGVPPLGASTSREPTDLPEGFRGEVSTSIAANAAELDALHGDLPFISLNQPGELKLRGR